MIEVRLVDRDNVIQKDMERFVRRIINFRQSDRRQVERAVRRGFAKSFSNEGQELRWRSLAELTVQDRLRQGYPGRHPIQIRSGAYMQSFVNPGHSDHVYEYSQKPAGWRIESGSREERVQWLEYGTRFIPPRPVADFGSRTQLDVENVVEGIFDRIFDQITSR